MGGWGGGWMGGGEYREEWGRRSPGAALQAGKHARAHAGMCGATPYARMHWLRLLALLCAGHGGIPPRQGAHQAHAKGSQHLGRPHDLILYGVRRGGFSWGQAVIGDRVLACRQSPCPGLLHWAREPVHRVEEGEAHDLECPRSHRASCDGRRRGRPPTFSARCSSPHSHSAVTHVAPGRRLPSS